MVVKSIWPSSTKSDVSSQIISARDGCALQDFYFCFSKCTYLNKLHQMVKHMVVTFTLYIVWPDILKCVLNIRSLCVCKPLIWEQINQVNGCFFKQTSTLSVWPVSLSLNHQSWQLKKWNKWEYVHIGCEPPRPLVSNKFVINYNHRGHLFFT